MLKLVANAWDAGANEVRIVLPSLKAYNPKQSQIVITDTGAGMEADEIETKFLVLGRNRRTDQPSPHGRKVMGRDTIQVLATAEDLYRQRLDFERSDAAR